MKFNIYENLIWWAHIRTFEPMKKKKKHQQKLHTKYTQFD